MERFIIDPNLPRGNVSLGIVDGRTRDTIINKLNSSGIQVIRTDRCSALYDAVSFHPDMFIHHIGGRDIVTAPNAPEPTIKKLLDFGFNIIWGGTPLTRKYPGDTAYNVARIGEYAVCNAAYTDKVLLKLLEGMGVKIIDVKQGYAKCSICIISPDAIITSDDGLYRALNGYGFDILKINTGFISLPKLSYGFIGGASGLISKDEAAFSGNIELHPDFKKIKKFAASHGKSILNLDELQLVDIGTFIPLKEYGIEEICKS